MDTIDTKYPTKLNRSEMTKGEWIKERTIELYHFLPQTSLEDRFKCTDIRDEIINLNYKFFGYVATSTYVNNTCVSYEDKFQSAAVNFCQIWHKYLYEKEYAKGKKYRSDVSFAVFFKPRLSEMVQRELTSVKYSTERQLKIEAGAQLGKHWSKVNYDDLKNVKLPVDKMQSLKAIFGCMYWADLEVHELYIGTGSTTHSEEFENLYSDKYSSKVELLMHEMVERESLIDDSTLLEIAEIQDIPFEQLKVARPIAEKKLYAMLKDSEDIASGFNTENLSYSASSED